MYRVVLGALVLLTTASVRADSLATPRCAVRIDVTASVKDQAGKPVSGAELWFVDTLGGAIEGRQAWLVGSTGTDGVARADVCYQAEFMFCAKAPQGTSHLQWFVLKENYGVVKVDRRVPATRLVKEGWALRGEPCAGATSHRIGEEGVKGFALPLSITLRSAQ